MLMMMMMVVLVVVVVVAAVVVVLLPLLLLLLYFLLSAGTSSLRSRHAQTRAPLLPAVGWSCLLLHRGTQWGVDATMYLGCQLRYAVA